MPILQLYHFRYLDTVRNRVLSSQTIGNVGLERGRHGFDCNAKARNAEGLGLLLVVVGTNLHDLGSLMYRDGPQDQFLNPALQQALFGLAFGLVCALVFTLVQNGVNKERRKVKSWIFAVLIWIVMRLAWLFAAGAL